MSSPNSFGEERLRFAEFRSRISADGVSIMRSHSGRGGVRYETVETIELG